MINILQIALRQLFLASYEESLDPDQESTPKQTLTVRFAPPNGSFPADGETSPFLNVFLVDVRENRKLRRNEKISAGSSASEQTAWASARLDCHFLTTARVKNDTNHDPEKDTLEESHLLYQAAAALLRHAPLNLRAIFRIPDTFPEPEDITDATVWPTDLLGDKKDADLAALKEDPTLLSRRLHVLPVEIMPPDGFPKLSEFWGLMGAKAHWRPCVYFVVTLPVEKHRRHRGPLVQTIASRLINQVELPDDPDKPSDPNVVPTRDETILSIGGVVLRKGTSVPQADVLLQGEAIRLWPDPKDPEKTVRRNVKLTFSSVTDDAGRFRFSLAPDDLGPAHEDLTWRIVVLGQTFPLATPLKANHQLEIHLTNP